MADAAKLSDDLVLTAPAVCAHSARATFHTRQDSDPDWSQKYGTSIEWMPLLLVSLTMASPTDRRSIVSENRLSVLMVRHAVRMPSDQ